MKLRVFIASSSQAKPLTHRVASWLTDWHLEALPWDAPGLFRPGDYILSRLLELSDQVDAAIIIFGEEDKSWYHADAQPQPRDNVLIEYGILSSRLGPRRTVVCRRGNPKTASDLGGLIFINLQDKGRHADAKQRLHAWVATLPDLVRESQQREGERRRAERAPLRSGVDARFSLPSRRRRTISIVTGSLRDIRDVDVVVSSENTDLQPSRYAERTMSGTLRYLDAERNPSDLRITRDAYLESLEDAKRRHRVQVPVLPGAVLPVPTTGLRNQGIKYVFQAATVQGAIETGYFGAGEAIDEAIRNSFGAFSELAKTDSLRSILFPLFGGGTAGLDPDLVAMRMIEAIEKGLTEHSDVKHVILFAHIDSHRRALRRAAAAANWRLQR